MNRKSLGPKLFLALAVCCLSIDIFTNLGGLVAPVAMGRAICALRPLGWLSELLFPLNWSLYVDASCARTPDKIAVSIVALMLKFSIVALGIIAAIAIMGLRETASSSSEEPPLSASKETSRRSWIGYMIILLSLAALSWWLFVSDRAEDLHPSMLSALCEDALLFAFFGTGLLVWAAFLDLALLPILRWLFPKGRWIRTD